MRKYFALLALACTAFVGWPRHRERGTTRQLGGALMSQDAHTPEATPHRTTMPDPSPLPPGPLSASHRVPPIGATQRALETSLLEETPNPNWAHNVLEGTRELLSVDPEIDVAVDCGQTLCRIKLTKPLISRLDWPEIDRVLLGIATGETVMTTETSGKFAVGYVYFSADDANLAPGS